MAVKLPRWAKLTGIFFLCALFLFVFFAWLAAPLLPFLIALALARLMEPCVRFLHEKLSWPRPLGSLLMTVLLVALLLGVLFFIVSWAMREVNKLIERLPYFMTQLPEISGTWREQADLLIEAAPLSLQEVLRGSLDTLWSEGINIPSSLYTLLVGWVSGLAAAIPSAGLFLFAALLSTYLISKDYPAFSAKILSPFSDRIRGKILLTKDHTFETLGKWFRAQVYMMGLTFLILLAGFMILRVELALLPAVVITLLDALPVIGAGFCLLPWALISFIGGNTGLAIGLLVVYTAIVLTRSLVEPRLVGRQIGMDPLLTFAAMYIGFKMVGIFGMVLFPVLAMVLYRVIRSLLPAEGAGAQKFT